jgi:hypothetical protein
MKALSVQQPWAWAIIHAGKDIENRTWRTHYRGWVVIHASVKPRSERSMPRGVRKPRPDDLVRGVIVGVARLTDVVNTSRSKWFDGPYGAPLNESAACACVGLAVNGHGNSPPDLLYTALDATSPAVCIVGRSTNRHSDITTDLKNSTRPSLVSTTFLPAGLERDRAASRS